MTNYLVYKVRLHCIEDVKEVLSRRKLPLLGRGWEKDTQFCIFLHIVPEALNTQLIVVGDHDGPKLTSRYELLLVNEDLLDEVFVHHGDRRAVELY